MRSARPLAYGALILHGGGGRQQRQHASHLRPVRVRGRTQAMSRADDKAGTVPDGDVTTSDEFNVMDVILQSSAGAVGDKRPTTPAAIAAQNGAASGSGGKRKSPQHWNNKSVVDLVSSDEEAAGASSSAHVSKRARPKLTYQVAEPAAAPISQHSVGGLQRHWVDASVPHSDSDAAPTPTGSMDFRICSYNVLCQRTIYETLYLYNHCGGTAHLDWESHRWPLLRAELTALAADVFCLQEVQDDLYERDIGPWFERNGYWSTFKRRTGGGKSDGCALAGRRAKFTLAQCRDVEYQMPGCSLMDRGNVGQVAVLRPVVKDPRLRDAVPPPPLIVSNTHLLFNEKRGDIKLLQLAWLVANVQQVRQEQAVAAAAQCGSSPPACLMCGDYNMEPVSPLYLFVMAGRLRYASMRRNTLSGQIADGNGNGNPRYDPYMPSHGLIPASMHMGADCRVSPHRYDHRQAMASVSGVSGGGAQLFAQADAGALHHQMPVLSVYRHAVERAGGAPPQYEISSYHGRGAHTVDYIFYTIADKRCEPPTAGVGDGASRFVCSDVLESRRLRCLHRLSLPTVSQLDAAVGRMPNAHCASDHLPLAADFRLAW